MKTREEKYYSIKEFADMVGVSRQAIYKRLSTDLQPFIEYENGIKVLNSKAFRLFEESTSLQDSLQTENLQRMISILEANAESLREQLKIKDKQIDTLNHQVEELNARLKESHFLIGRQQELQAISEKEEAPAEPAEPIIVEPTPEPAPPDPDEENLSDQEIYKRALEKLPPAPKLFDRVLRPELWQRRQKEAIAQMTKREREVLFKYGFVGDGR